MTGAPSRNGGTERGAGTALCERCGDMDEFVRKAAPLAAELTTRGFAVRRKKRLALFAVTVATAIFSMGTRRGNSGDA